MNSSAEVVARAVGGPSNSSRIGVDAAARNITTTADAALKRARIERSDVSAIGAGLAGTTDLERRQRVHARLQAGFPNARVMVMTDLDAALAAGPEGPTIVLVAGTGSAAIGRNDRGEVVRVGGYGRFSSDEGSAFDVGKKAIQVAIAEREKNRSETHIGEQILLELRCADWPQVQERARAAPDDVYPLVFPVIAAAADAGDGVACNVLRDAVEKLCSLAMEAAIQLALAQTGFALVKTGGMLGRSKFFDHALTAAVRKQLPNARDANLKMSPAEAAGRIAKEAYD